MLIEQSSNLIRETRPVTLASGADAEAAMLINHSVLVIASDAVAQFTSLEAVQDPLGNGLLQSVSLPADFQLAGPPFIERHQAGYVGLKDGRALLIGLNDVRVFESAQDALRNHNEIARLPLQAVAG